MSERKGWVVKARFKNAKGNVHVKTISKNFTNEDAAKTYVAMAKKDPTYLDVWHTENFT